MFLKFKPNNKGLSAFLNTDKYVEELSYTHFSEVLKAFIAEGTIIVITVTISFTLLKPVNDAPKRHIQFLGFRMTVWVHIFVNKSYIHSVLFLLPLASTYQNHHLAAHVSYPITPRAES